MNDSQRTSTEKAPTGESGASSAAQVREIPSQAHLVHAGLVPVYRVVAADRAAGAFSHDDNLAGGRWSSPGIAAIYAAQSPAGAVLEYLAHMTDDRPEALVLVHGHLPSGEVAPPGPLPERWRDMPYREEVRAFGDRWLRSGQAVALSLPSALCEASRNLLVNPDHPRMGRLELVKVEAFILDPRLVFPR
jgi:RES domain-containing protein